MGLMNFCQSVTPYKLWVLALCLLAYLLNQLDRYLLPILSLHIAQDIHYGDKGCLSTSANHKSVKCVNFTTEASCKATAMGNVSMCEWNYNGQGVEYQLIAGPVFIVIYTLAGIAIGYLAVKFKPHKLLAGFVILWSIFTALSGLCTQYWHMVLTRFGLGIGEAGCTPFAAAMIAELYPAEVRGSAMGIYNFGIYLGYSMSYAFGNFLYDANIMGQSWRWVFYISAMPGLPVALLIFFTIKSKSQQSKTSRVEPDENSSLIRDDETSQRQLAVQMTWRQKLLELFFTFLSPPLLMLCLAGSIRNAGGYVWAVSTQNYFESLNQTQSEIGRYMSWIPLVGGSFGAFFGGFISDRFVKSRGIPARIFVLVLSQLCAAPFALLALLLEPPAAYIMLLPSNIIGEMWIGVCLTCVLELVPDRIRAAAVAYYLFIITNIGGNIPLLIPPLRQAFALNDAPHAFRNALIVLYPGMYLASSVLFVMSIVVYKCWERRKSSGGYEVVDGEGSNSSSLLTLNFDEPGSPEA